MSDNSDQFYNSVQIHGLTDVRAAKSRAAKGFWIVTLTMMLIMLSENVYTACLEFYQFSMVTSTTVTGRTAIAFPHVAVCPQAFLNYSKVENDFPNDWQDIVKHLMSIHQVADIYDALRVNLSSGSVPDESTKKHLLEKLLGSIRLVNEFLNDYSIDSDKIFKKCVFRRRHFECGENIEKLMYIGTRYFCYVIKVGRPQKRRNHGLWLELQIPKGYDSNFGLVPITGVIVMLGYSLPAYNLVFVQSGDRTRVELTVNGLDFQPTAAQPCLTSNELIMNAPDILNGSAYNPISCQRDCSQKAIWQSCKCLQVEDHKLLNATMAEQRVCTKEIMSGCIRKARDFRRHELRAKIQCHSGCLQLCKRELLRTQENSISFEEVQSKYNIPGADTGFHYINDTDSAIVLEIMFDEMVVANSTQKAALSFNNFVSNVGGIIGLWIGGSMLAIVQIIVYGAKFLYEYLRKNSTSIVAEGDSSSK